MTTLVTGATGGFGRIFSAWMCGNSADPVVLTGRAARQDDNYLACDFTDRAAVRTLVRRVQPRLVFHLAGSFGNDYDTNYTVNAEGARHLLDVLREERLNTRIVLMGSAAEYGLIRPEENPVTEDHALRPVSSYGLTKVFQTQIACYYAHAFGADVVVARMFNLFAPGLSERLFVGRVERLIERYRRGDTATIDVGNLESQRDYIAAPDAIAQIERIAARGARGAVYHVASGVGVVMRDVLYRMLDAAGVPRTAARDGTLAASGRTGYDAPIIYANLCRTRALEMGSP